MRMSWLKLNTGQRGSYSPVEQLNSNRDKKSSFFLFCHTVVTTLSWDHFYVPVLRYSYRVKIKKPTDMIFYIIFYSYLLLYLDGTNDIMSVDIIPCIPIYNYIFPIYVFPVVQLWKTVLVYLATNSEPVAKSNSRGKNFNFTVCEINT